VIIYQYIYNFYQELKRLVAYARSSANLLAKLTFLEEIGPFRWEVSGAHFSDIYSFQLLTVEEISFERHNEFFYSCCSAFLELL